MTTQKITYYEGECHGGPWQGRQLAAISKYVRVQEVPGQPEPAMIPVEKAEIGTYSWNDTHWYWNP